MNVVVQGHSWGCGVACVAYVSNREYASALKVFESPEYAWKCGYMCRDLVNALSKLGKQYEHRYYRPHLKRYLEIPGTIVFVGRNKKYPGGHYLVRTKNGKWMNPWSNFPRIDPANAALQNRLPGKVQYIIFAS